MGRYRSNISLIATLTSQGVSSAMTIEGSLDTLAFDAYAEHSLFPTLKPGQTVVMDNLKIHYSPTTIQLIESVECSALHLPIYSPDLAQTSVPPGPEARLLGPTPSRAPSPNSKPWCARPKPPLVNCSTSPSVKPFKPSPHPMPIAFFTHAGYLPPQWSLLKLSQIGTIRGRSNLTRAVRAPRQLGEPCPAQRNCQIQGCLVHGGLHPQRLPRAPCGIAPIRITQV